MNAVIDALADLGIASDCLSPATVQ